MVVVFFAFTDVESTATNNVIDENDNDREIQASHAATAIAADRSFYINDVGPFVPETPYEGHGTGPLEAVEQQGAGQTNSTFYTGCSDQPLNSVAESSGQTSALAITLALNSLTPR
jgi:hypothetical protein